MDRRFRLLAPLGLACLLFILNNLSIIGGWVNPPAGYAPAFINRGDDFAQYLTWMNAFQTQNLLPNYHAPWRTEPAFFNAVFYFIARICKQFAVQPLAGYYLLHFFFYLIAAYALFYVVETFTEKISEILATGLVLILSVPVSSLSILPIYFLTRGQWTPYPKLPGIGDFVYWSSDGFLHGISGSILVTFATASMLLAFALMARYLQTERLRYFFLACLTTGISAYIHPFEVVVIVGASALTLLYVHWKKWRKAALEIGAIAISGLIGVAPIAITGLQHEWIRAVAEINRWQPPNPFRLLVILGIPTILALIFLVLRPRMATNSDRLLQAWFIVSLIGVYVPFIHWSQHLLDGFLYCAALLLVRQVSQNNFLPRFKKLSPRLATAGLVILLCLSILPYLLYPWQSFKDGMSATPERLFSAVVTKDEQGALSWIKNHVSPDQLVLAPQANSAWVATAPVHSFASQFPFSITYSEQRLLADKFYQGEMGQDQAQEFLDGYGVSFVLVPAGSPALVYLHPYPKQAQFGKLLIYELPGNVMKPYSGVINE